jgi:histidine triad (HIT) family protein
MAYDDSNIFARIIRGELPCHKVWEDEATLAFLDIMPMTKGHTLVLPKAPIVTIYEATEADLAATMAVVRKLAIAAKSAFAADGLTVQQFNEAAGGQSVPHLHFHVLPRWTDTPLRPHAGTPEKEEVLEELAGRLRVALGQQL